MQIIRSTGTRLLTLGLLSWAAAMPAQAHFRKLGARIVPKQHAEQLSTALYRTAAGENFARIAPENTPVKNVVSDQRQTCSANRRWTA